MRYRIPFKVMHENLINNGSVNHLYRSRQVVWSLETVVLYTSVSVVAVGGLGLTAKSEMVQKIP